MRFLQQLAMKPTLTMSLIILVVLIALNLVGLMNCLEFNLKGLPGDGYYLDVQVGTPPQNFTVIVDTGSSNFAIAAWDNDEIRSFFHVNESSTFNSLGRNLSAEYTQGNWSGTLGTDLIKFPTLAITSNVRAFVSLIEKSNNFFINTYMNGILGMAYPKLSRPDRSVIPWLDDFQRQKNYSSIGFSLELCGVQGQSRQNNNHFGVLSILNSSESYSNQMKFTATILHDRFYEITLTRISINNETIDMDCQDLNNDKTIIDSGSENLRLPEKVFAKLIPLLETFARARNISIKQEFLQAREIVCFNSPQNWNVLPNISISIASDRKSYFTLDLPGMSYIRPVYNVSHELKHCYRMAIETSKIGTVLGVVVLEGYKIIFNRTAKLVHFMESECGPNVGLRGPFHIRHGSFFRMCVFRNASTAETVWTFAKMCFIPVLILIAIMLATALSQVALWFFKTKINKSLTSNVFFTLHRTRLVNEE